MQRDKATRGLKIIRKYCFKQSGTFSFVLLHYVLLQDFSEPLMSKWEWSGHRQGHQRQDFPNYLMREFFPSILCSISQNYLRNASMSSFIISPGIWPILSPRYVSMSLREKRIRRNFPTTFPGSISKSDVAAITDKPQIPLASQNIVRVSLSDGPMQMELPRKLWKIFPLFSTPSSDLWLLSKTGHWGIFSKLLQDSEPWMKYTEPRDYKSFLAWHLPI